MHVLFVFPREIRASPGRVISIRKLFLFHAESLPSSMCTSFQRLRFKVFWILFLFSGPHFLGIEKLNHRTEMERRKEAQTSRWTLGTILSQPEDLYASYVLGVNTDISNVVQQNRTRWKVKFLTI